MLLCACTFHVNRLGLYIFTACYTDTPKIHIYRNIIYIMVTGTNVFLVCLYLKQVGYVYICLLIHKRSMHADGLSFKYMHICPGKYI